VSLLFFSPYSFLDIKFRRFSGFLTVARFSYWPSDRVTKTFCAARRSSC
jgi:hypothetical protein